jgi:diguanylate cyclase (GGDEF)-like protein/putative nucleotidyltransferase with HDIG domain
MVPNSLGLDAALLVRLGQELRQELDVEGMLERLHALLEEQTRLKVLILVQDSSEELLCQPPLPHPCGSGISACALMERWGGLQDPVGLSDEGTLEPLIGLLGWQGIRSLTIVPIQQNGRLRGILLVGLPVEGPVSARERELLSAIAAQVWLGVTSATWRRSERDELAEASLLLELANLLGGMRSLPELLDYACQLIRERLGLECSILLRDGTGEEMVGRSSSHLSPEVLQALRTGPGGSLLYRAVDDGYLHLTSACDDAAAAVLTDGAVGGAGGLLTVRIDHQGELLGLLVLIGNGCISLRRSFLGLCRGVGRQIGLAVHHLLLHDRLRLQAMTDELTGVGNHRRFQDTLNGMLCAGGPFGLVLADVDHFKHFNDTFGHQLGDRALRTVASVLQSQLGDAGIVCRYGGEEFAILLPGVGEIQAHAVAERLRDGVAARVATALGLANFSLTISMGVACFPTHSREKDGLTGMADLALYEAKARGRNCVRVYHSTLRALNCNVTHRERHTLPTLNTLSALLRAKDEYTYAHSVRVARMAAALAQEMGLSEGEVRTVEWGALLHDIGKLEIDRRILTKPTKLTQEEWALVKQHPLWGADLLGPIPLLSAAVPIVRWHHERWDGKGYPDGLEGEEIPVVARIVAVADSFDAMTYVRAYQTRKGAVAVAAEMLHCAGTQFDPNVVEALMALQRKQGKVAN